MAAKRAFTESEQKQLKRNPYTYQVTAQEIHFTLEFDVDYLTSALNLAA